MLVFNHLRAELYCSIEAVVFSSISIHLIRVVLRQENLKIFSFSQITSESQYSDSSGHLGLSRQIIPTLIARTITLISA